jgi:hypothetical protein
MTARWSDPHRLPAPPPVATSGTSAPSVFDPHALIEAATHAARHPAYRERYERTKKRLGRQRGSKVARVEIARELSSAIWHMLTKSEPFAPGRPPVSALVA